MKLIEGLIEGWKNAYRFISVHVKLIEGWKNAYRFISVQAMVGAGAIQSAWLFVPEDLRHSIPQSWLQGLTVALMIMGVAGRLVKQKELP